MNRIITVAFSIFFFSVSCCQNSDFEKVFNEEEQSTINDIVIQFDEVIKQETGNNDISNAYLDFAECLKRFESIDDYYDKINSLKNGIDKIIEENKETEFFNNTWIRNYGFKPPSWSDTLTTMLEFKLKPKYFKFLKRKSSKNKYLKEYLQTIEWSLSIPPSLSGSSQYLIDALDMNDKSDRLIIAIHFITIVSETEIKPAANTGE
jgi:hypothetical protein